MLHIGSDMLKIIVTAQVISLKAIRLKDTDIPWAAKAVFGEYYT